MRTGRPGHLKQFDYRGFHRYFLTFCTYDRKRQFVEPGTVEIVLAQVLRAAEQERFAILAYCFMPDHVHLLVEGESENAECLRFIARAKQFSGFHFLKHAGTRLWQRYGFERALRSEEDTLAVARYIFENPVRAGLVSAPEEYAHSGSARYSIAAILGACGYDPQWSG